MASQTFEIIRTARSVRQYQDKPLPDDVVREILEAGRLSGSSKNTQPWSFIVVRDKDQLKRLAEAGDYSRHMPGSAMTVALVTEEVSPRPGQFAFDLGRASQNMVIAAWALGIGSCVVYFHHAERAFEVLGLPEGMISHYGVTFGYPAEDLDRAPRKGGRNPADKVIHWGQW